MAKTEYEERLAKLHDGATDELRRAVAELRRIADHYDDCRIDEHVSTLVNEINRWAVGEPSA